MKIFLVVFLLSCAFSFFVFYCLWFYFMELGDWEVANQKELESLILNTRWLPSWYQFSFPVRFLKKPTFFSAIGMRQFLWHGLHYYLNMMVNISALKTKEKPEGL